LDITTCDLQSLNSAFVSSNLKSPGKRFIKLCQPPFLLSNWDFPWNIFLLDTDFHNRRIYIKVCSNLIRDI